MNTAEREIRIPQITHFTLSTDDSEDLQMTRWPIQNVCEIFLDFTAAGSHER